MVKDNGITGYAKSRFQRAVDGAFDTIVGTVWSIEDSMNFSPTLRKRGSNKIDAVRRAFKYESLVYHAWRSIWCTYVTIVALYNFLRLRTEFGSTYGDHEQIPYHSHYDRKTSWDVMMVIIFLSIDILIYMIRGKFMSRSVLTHHLFGIALCVITLLSKYPHHYYANLFMCTEIVSCLTILAHYSKKCRSKMMHKVYLFQYLLLTIFARGWIWITITSDLISNEVTMICYLGVIPLILMDIIWSRQCIQGLMK